MSLWEENDDFLARWLSDELSPEEKAEFENSAEGKEYVQMVQAADKLSAPAYDAQGELNKLKGRIKASEGEVKATKVIFMRPILRYAVAASLAAILVVAYFVSQPTLTTFNTAPGQQEIVMLPDGSEVKMNAATTLAYNENTWADERAINLEGEAFFQVKKGSSFVVNTEYGSVTVLGTSFNVRTRNNKLEVFCYTGKVNVSSTNANTDLLPGDGVRVEQGRITSTWKKPEAINPGWMEGVTFYDEPVPLSEALEELSVIFGIEILEQDYPDSLKFRGPILHSNAAQAVKLVMDQNENFVKYEYDSANNTLKILSIDR